MARPLANSPGSTALTALVRTHFGLAQPELAAYLGVSPRQIGNVEAGRRRLTPLANLRLVRLARLLPPPDGTGPAAPEAPVYASPATPGVLFGPELPLPPEVGTAALAKRQRQLTRRLATLRRDLYALTDRLTHAARRRWALPLLQQALLQPVAAEDPAAATPAELAHAAHWLAVLAASPVLRRGPDVAAATALLLVRLAATEAQIATLAALLARAV